MTTAVATQFRTLSFGDIGGEVWGAAMHAQSPAFVFGVHGEIGSAAGPEAIEWSRDGRGWRLAGEGIELDVEPLGEDPPHSDDPSAEAGLTAVGDLCRVQGVISVAGSEHPVDCVGTRCTVDGIDVESLGSVRAVSGWFGDDAALALVALRPRRGVGHESDLIAATLFDPEGWVAVQDPRLSTTYTGSGLPARANLELWIGEGEAEFPCRAAAEATGTGAIAVTEGYELRVAPLRCHSRGLEGAGVYVLASF
jgi:hypothetical protein